MRWGQFAVLLALCLLCFLGQHSNLHAQQPPATAAADPLPGSGGLHETAPPVTLGQPQGSPPALPPDPGAGPVVPVSPAEAVPPPFLGGLGGEVNPPRPDTYFPTYGENSPFYNPAVGHALLRADYRFTWFGSEAVSGQTTNLRYVEHDFGFAFPIWQCGTDEWSAAAHVRAEIFRTSAILPSTLQPFPDELWNIHFSTTYRHQFDNGWIGGGSVSVGSASDKPFHSIDEMTAGSSLPGLPSDDR